MRGKKKKKKDRIRNVLIRDSVGVGPFEDKMRALLKMVCPCI